MRVREKHAHNELGPEAREALGEMRASMRSVYKLMREMDRSSRAFRDEVEPPRHGGCRDDGPVSSVRGRKRRGEGVAPHELRAGKKPDTIDGDALLESVAVDSLLDKVFGAPSASSMSLVVPRGGGGTYLDRHLLKYYLGHMAETSAFLDRISFYQSEEFKVDRLYGDMYRRNDAVNAEYDADREWAAQEALLRSSADLAVERDRIAADLANDAHYRNNR